jgi:uncharacterized protein (DUF697 family)
MGKRWGTIWKQWRRLWPAWQMSDEEYRRQQARILSKAPVPLFWLLGKTGSGKTSVIHFLTGAEQAEIGDGFRPQTRTSREYDFPSSEAPLVRFLDTRGLAEAHYDPTEDLQRFNEQANVVVVTARVMDHALAPVIEPLTRIRRARPERPVLLVLTCLHEAYPRQQHPLPDPFEGQQDFSGAEVPSGLGPDLLRSLQLQQQRFTGLVDRIVPVDLTPPEEGFSEPEFGGDRLRAALVDLLPTAYRQTLLFLDDSMRSLSDLNERRALPYVLGYGMMAATAAAVPLPWVDIPVVTALQSHLVYRLARIYNRPLAARTFLEMAGPIGGRLLARQLLRGATKIIPYVGIAANAALAYAYTFALGKACCWYFGQLHQGNAPTSEQLQEVWHAELTEAATTWSRRPDAENLL